MILFDFDGTLADTFLLGASLINDYAARFGYENIDFEKNKDKSARELIKMANVHFWEIPRLIRFFRRETISHAQEIEAFSGIPELVTSLHNSGLALGVVSTNTEQILRTFLDKYNLPEHFRYFTTEVSLFGKKRALRQARRKLRRMGHDGLIYIGDELRDIEACNAADIPIISCAWGFNSYDVLSENNNFVAKDCGELEEMITNYITAS
ncbi:MAG: HAD hydrolase-like protein [Bacteroidales bacterium]|nr:HAD hydrolase-like protein [Bacteroidales bacterium]